MHKIQYSTCSPSKTHIRVVCNKIIHVYLFYNNIFLLVYSGMFEFRYIFFFIYSKPQEKKTPIFVVLPLKTKRIGTFICVCVGEWVGGESVG